MTIPITHAMWANYPVIAKSIIFESLPIDSYLELSLVDRNTQNVAFNSLLTLARQAVNLYDARRFSRSLNPAIANSIKKLRVLFCLLNSKHLTGNKCIQSIALGVFRRLVAFHGFSYVRIGDLLLRMNESFKHAAANNVSLVSQQEGYKLIAKVNASSSWILRYGYQWVLDCKSAVLDLLNRKAITLELVSRNLRSDRDVVLAAVEQRGEDLRLASASLQADKHIVLTAIKQNGWALSYASPELRMDKKIIIQAVRQNVFVWGSLSSELQADEDIKEAVKYLSPESKTASIGPQQPSRVKRPFVALPLLEQEGVGSTSNLAIPFSGSQFLADSATSLNRYPQIPCYMVFTDPNVRKDKKAMLAIIQQDPTYLQFASPELQGDVDILLEAARKDTGLLRFTNPNLLNSKECSLSVIEAHGLVGLFTMMHGFATRRLELTSIQEDTLVWLYAKLKLRKT